MDVTRFVGERPDGWSVAVMQVWVEHESGWGQRPDGWSLHADDVQLGAYLNARRRAPEGDEYDRPSGKPFEVLVTPEAWRRVYDAEYGLRRFGFVEIPDVGRRFDVPDGAHDAAAYIARLHAVHGR